ncbi:carboxymuconolactone decarboxylase family protein [Candidatus Methanoperedens nitratireducens]|uniref:Carboxymuconolactone decarboxylase-like domain-containing protein n=1 Tax=Candidatus Methanoperedens nitratireducens TaxID=1392998 RepID=A0A284VSC9_9EURY|nr:carboxymuconolactone decarboxylase family protein [Candidatus Methanoperedens nitroreducens]SNQ62190.1 hypothetical protein MNV_60071 [Candidatus Methanoperedens nitroreducens]
MFNTAINPFNSGDLMPEHPVFADGALPGKFKLLIAMAFDASYGAVQGVKVLAQQAMEAGATKEEIAEALRVAQHLSGVGCIYTAGQALKELFD